MAFFLETLAHLVVLFLLLLARLAFRFEAMMSIASSVNWSTLVAFFVQVHGTRLRSRRNRRPF